MPLMFPCPFMVIVAESLFKLKAFSPFFPSHSLPFKSTVICLLSLYSIVSVILLPELSLSPAINFIVSLSLALLKASDSVSNFSVSI